MPAKRIKIAVIPGDGIGKEVVPEGTRVLEAVAKRFSIDIELGACTVADQFHAPWCSSGITCPPTSACTLSVRPGETATTSSSELPIVHWLGAGATIASSSRSTTVRCSVARTPVAAAGRRGPVT